MVYDNVACTVALAPLLRKILPASPERWPDPQTGSASADVLWTQSLCVILAVWNNYRLSSAAATYISTRGGTSSQVPYTAYCEHVRDFCTVRRQQSLLKLAVSRLCQHSLSTALRQLVSTVVSDLDSEATQQSSCTAGYGTSSPGSVCRYRLC